MITKSHNYFLLPYNSLPLIISLNTFNLMFSFLMFMKFGMIFNFFMNIMIMVFTSFYWWIFYSSEFNLEGFNTFNLEKGIKFSMLLFISSEVLFFFSFFWSYFHFFLSPTMETGLSWPPLMVQSFDCLDVPLVNTLILLSSGVTVTISHMFFIKGQLKSSSFYLSVTILMGLVFSIFQYMEYNNSFFSINDSNFGTSFFMLTGFHGIHVLIGTMFLMVSLWRHYNSSSMKEGFLMFELASWYWHFVDVVWMFLYFFLYFMNNV